MIERIAELGDDALGNLFTITFSGTPTGVDLEDLSFRIQAFTVPSTGGNTYEVHYKTQSMTKPGGKVDMPHEFSFDFRVDRNWNLYTALKTWRNLKIDPYVGNIGSDADSGTNNRGSCIVSPIDGNGDEIDGAPIWTFNGIYPNNIGDVGFDYTQGDPIIVTVGMVFIRMNSE